MSGNLISDILSVGLILVLGFIMNFLFEKIHIPGLVGMIIIGLIIGPEVLDLLSDNILAISSGLRTIGLIIILAKSGLNLDIDNLKRIGRPAFLMAFFPPLLEVVGALVGSIWFLDINKVESLTLGSILGAVSPAVVSIRMIKLIETGYGRKHKVPELILTGSNLDDIFMIILFYSFLSLAETSKFNGLLILGIPIAIILGIALGILVGAFMVFIIKKKFFDDLTYILIFFGVALLMDGFEHFVNEVTEGTKIDFFAVSGLLGINIAGIIIFWKTPEKAKVFSMTFKKFWKFFEIILFVLVGSGLVFNKEFKKNAGWGILVIFIGLIFRSVGVLISLIMTDYTFKERLFVIIAYMPKATVQASIGGVAASRGLKCGNILQAVSIIAIIITAPLGAFGMDCLHSVLLEKDEVDEEEKNKEGKEGKEDAKESNNIINEELKEEFEIGNEEVHYEVVESERKLTKEEQVEANKGKEEVNYDVIESERKLGKEEQAEVIIINENKKNVVL